MARKNITIQSLKDTVNRWLQDSTSSADVRQGMITTLEQALHETKNYNGFGYLRECHVPAGQKPGVRYLDGVPYPDYDERFKDCDDTRRVYY